MAAIDVVELGRVFSTHRLSSRGPGIVALREVSFAVPEATICGLLGGNGAGKTTLLEILATLIRPSSGAASIDGCDVQQQAAGVRRRIAYCPAGGTAFYGRLTGRQNLEFFGALHDVPVRDLAARIDDAAAVFDVREALDRRVEAYSDGMRQRLALARAHLARARVWLLDEPTRGLDPRGRELAGQVLRDRVRTAGVTMLLTTHDLREAVSVCDHVVVLHRGRVTLSAPVSEFRQAPGALEGAYLAATGDAL
jgi:ABC-type multidrug transport system ATPase subunit